MEQILTIVSSVLGTLVVVFIIGTVIGLRKVLKDNVILNNNIADLRKEVDEIHKRIDIESQGITAEMEDRFKDVYEHRLREIQESLDRLYDSLSSNTGEVYSDMDRRFDKLYSKIYEKFPDLKASYTSVKDALDNLFKANGTSATEETN